MLYTVHVWKNYRKFLEAEFHSIPAALHFARKTARKLHCRRENPSTWIEGPRDAAVWIEHGWSGKSAIPDNGKYHIREHM